MATATRFLEQQENRTLSNEARTIVQKILPLAIRENYPLDRPFGATQVLPVVVGLLQNC